MTKQEAEIWLAMLLSQYGELSITELQTKHIPEIVIPPEYLSGNNTIPLCNFKITLELSHQHQDSFCMTYIDGLWIVEISRLMFSSSCVKLLTTWDSLRTYKTISYHEFFNLKDET